MREIITTGKTVEEATNAALAQLGLTEDEVTIEILELPQKKLFKTIPARVKVTCDADVKAAEKEQAQAAKAAAPQRPQPAQAAPKAPEKPAHPAAPAKPAAPQKAAAPAVPAAPAAQERTEEEAIAAAVAAVRADDPEIPINIADNEKLASAVEYLQEICTKMGVPELVFSAMKQGEATLIKIDGEGAGSLIGHRGETMEALSYLGSLVANRAGGDYLKLGLDINHYRSKREANLIALATRIGTKVAKSGRSQTLEPMNPYERRIIHSAVSSVENVKSESTGEGANRRVCILCTGPNAKAGSDRPFRQADRRGPRPGGFNKPPFRNDKPGERSDRPNDRGPRGPRPPHRDGEFGERKSNVPGRDFADKPRDPSATPTAPRRTETVIDGADLPLYGKIEL